MVAYWIDYACSFLTTGAQWRLPISVQIIFASAAIGLIMLLPESPRWLLYHDRHDQAEEILARLYPSHDPDMAKRQMAKVLIAIEHEKVAANGKQYVSVSIRILHYTLLTAFEEDCVQCSSKASSASSTGLS